MAQKKTAKKSATKKSPAKKRQPSAAFMAPLQPSEALSAIVGSKALPRTEVVKKLWAHIKKHKLQDAKNKRMIKPDDHLAEIFGGSKAINMFEMMKHLKKHLKK